VVKGAVGWGIDVPLNKMVYMRKCPRHFGLSVSQPFSSFTHSEADAYIDPFDGQKKAKDQMTWLIKKGDAIMSNKLKVASINFCRKFGLKDPRIFRTHLIVSDDGDAHQRLAEIPRG
jgi:hypothetical protein